MIKSKLRQALRVPPLAAHCAYGCVVSAWALYTNDRFARRERIAQHWHALLLKVLSVRVRVHGEFAPGSSIIVANHISWLDIPVIGATVPTRFVSKAEVQNWPIAGLYADGSGTFYINRGAGATKELAEALAAFVKSGGLFTIFPEGTTGAGETVMRFQPRMFSVAVETGCQVQPIALVYKRNGQNEAIAPFIGDDELLPHLLRVMAQPGLEVDVHFCAPINAAGLDRNQVAELAQLAVEAIVCPGVTSLPKRRKARGDAVAAAL